MGILWCGTRAGSRDWWCLVFCFSGVVQSRDTVQSAIGTPLGIVVESDRG